MSDNASNMSDNKMSDNNISNNGEFYLLRQIPNILRARGFRLYLADGKQRTGQMRLVDLWLNGGAAVLGHTPPNLLHEIKNAASRGLYAPYPHFTENRFLKALSKLFPEKSFRLYIAPPQVLNEKISHKGTEDTKNNFLVKLWRPFDNSIGSSSREEILIPIIPGIQTWRDGLPYGLCVVVAASEDLLTKLPPSDMLSPILLATATRGIYDLIAATDRAKSIAAMKRITKALREKSTKREWQQNGIYLTLKKEPTHEEWAAMFNQFLEAGFLLPPIPSHPLILPGEMSDGEEAKLARAL